MKHDRPEDMSDMEWARECGAEPLETTLARAKFTIVAVGVCTVLAIGAWTLADWLIGLVKYFI